jgi:hypothetical protein
MDAAASHTPKTYLECAGQERGQVIYDTGVHWEQMYLIDSTVCTTTFAYHYASFNHQRTYNGLYS